MSKTYTVKQVAEALGFSTNTVYKYLNEGKIKATRLGAEGRFRIPESELTRLLGLKGGIKEEQALPPESPQGPSLPSALDEPKEGILESISAPSLFDWFVATLALFLGVSYLLFPTYTLRVELHPFASYITLIKFGLIFLGIALLLTDILKPVKKLFHRLIHLLLSILFASLAVIFFQIDYYPKVVGYVSLAGLLLATAIFKISDKARFVIFINLLVILGGLVFALFPQSFAFAPIAQWISQNHLIFAAIWYSLSLAVILMSIYGFYKGGIALFAVAAIIGGGAFAYAVLTFQEGFWEDVIYNIVLSSYILVLPFWHKFGTFARMSKRQFLEASTWFVLVLVLGFGLVFYLQASFKGYVANQSQKSLDVAISRIKLHIEGSKKEMMGFSQDPQLVASLKQSKKDPAEFDALLKRFYLNATTLRQVAIIDSKGLKLATYPNGTNVEKDISSKEYFQQAQRSRQTIIAEDSDPLFHSAPLNILVVLPVFDQDEFLGVVLGSIDLFKLSSKLAEIKFGSGGNFVVAAMAGKVIIHEMETQVFKEAKGSALRLALSGQKGQIEDYDSSGLLQLQTYAPISSLGWGVVARQPISQVFGHQSVASFVVFLSTIVMGVGSLIAILYLRR